jgi:hypothetical protein
MKIKPKCKPKEILNGSYSKRIVIGRLFIIFRFTAKRSITVNPPSEVLHASSIKK